MLVTILSLTVIALTAVLLRWLTVPSEVTASLSTASGALVPAVAIRRRESAKRETDRMRELLTGTFRRPALYVALIGAGLLGASEYLAYLVNYFVVGVASAGAEELGLLTLEDSLAIAESDSAAFGAALLAWVTIVCVAGPVGAFVAHRSTVGRPCTRSGRSSWPRPWVSSSRCWY